MKRHISAMAEKNPEVVHVMEATKKDYAKTVCGRKVDMCTITEMMNTPVNLVTVDSTSTVSNTISTITGSDRNNVSNSTFIPVKASNKKWVTTTTEDIRKIFNKFKRVDEVLDPYLELLKLLTIS